MLSAGPASQRFDHVLPSAVVCGDGSTKNDCERGAWTRLVPVLASLDRRMKLIVIADGLFSQGPQIRLLQEHGLRFLLAARDCRLHTSLA